MRGGDGSLATAWEERGTRCRLAGHSVFTLDLPASGVEAADPLLVLHGFPTSSFDFHLVIDTLRRTRRVLMLDMLGFGLSDKPDLRYSIELQADVVEAFVAETLGSGAIGTSARGSEELSAAANASEPPRIALLTHDMGDTVGGELLARQMEGRWKVVVTRRVVSNGSIYIGMAHLTQGQQLLLALPDERLDASVDPSGQTLVEALRATLGPDSVVADDELEAAWRMIARDGGDMLLPRTIRYIDDRWQREDRYTGAIESHPSPLAIVWGTEDPIAVPDMARRLHGVVEGSDLALLEDIGHYPMIEAPGRFAEAVVAALEG